MKMKSYVNQAAIAAAEWLEMQLYYIDLYSKLMTLCGLCGGSP